VHGELLDIKKQRPDLKLHGFGLKKTALKRATVRELLYSCDSMAWSDNAKKNDKDANDPRLALDYAAEVEMILGEPSFVQDQLFNWWIS
jgi:predicted nucleotidyltransferase